MVNLRNFQQIETDFPQIDTDPHFKTVVRYFRPSDYMAWGGMTVGAPAFLYMFEHLDPSGASKTGMKQWGRMAGAIGAVAGFFYAYQNSSVRLYGWTENAQEVKKAEAENFQPNSGQSSLDPYMQGVAHRNSVWSQLKFSHMPWFNTVDHPYHGPGQQASQEQINKRKEEMDD